MSEPYHPHQPHDLNNQPIIPEMVSPIPQAPPIPYTPAPHSHEHASHVHHNEDFLQSVLGEESHSSEKSGAKKIVQKIIAFEEEHPWMFFGITAVIIFLIVVGIISAFVSNGDSDTNETATTKTETSDSIKEEVPSENNNKTESDEQSTSQSKLPSTFSDSLSNSIAIHTLLTKPEMYDTLVFQNYNNIYLAGYFQNAQTFDRLLQIDIREKLNETDQKEAVYKAYYDLLKSTDEEARSNFQFLETVRDSLKTEESALFDQLKEDKNNLQSAFTSGGKNELLEKVAVSNATALKLTQVQNKYTSADILYGAYKRRLPVSEARLKDLEVNKRVIIENITIVPIERSGIEHRPTSEVLQELKVDTNEVDSIKSQTTDSLSSPGGISSSENLPLKQVGLPLFKSNSFFMDGAFNPLEQKAIDNILGPFFQ